MTWVNADVGRMADELIAQAREIPDERDPTGSRRAILCRAGAHLLHASAELLLLPLNPGEWAGVRPVAAPHGWCPACGALARGKETLHSPSCALAAAPDREVDPRKDAPTP